MRNLKIICQGKCVKLTNHQVCLSKPLKILPPEKMEIRNTCNQYRLVSKFEKHLSAITVAEQHPYITDQHALVQKIKFL